MSQGKVKQTIAKETFSGFANFSIFLSIPIRWSFVNLVQFRSRFINFSVVRSFYFSVLLTFVYHILLYLIISNRSGDIEKNPEPKANSCQSFSICHWNLNSISMHNFLKLSLLQAYITVHEFDVICLSETYLDSSINMMMII